MRLIRGNYDQAKETIKEAICSGSFSVDSIFDKCNFTELSSMEVVKMYSEMKCIFDTEMVVSINLANYEAKNVYTGSVANMNKFIDAKVIDKLVKKFGTDPRKELGMDQIINIGKMMVNNQPKDGRDE